MSEHRYFHLNPATIRPDADHQKQALRQIMRGDEQAFKQLFDQYQRRVFVYALKISRSPELAEEVLYLVFLKIWQHPKLEDIENLEAYIRVLTRNQTLKSLRKLQLDRKTNQIFAVQNEHFRNDTEEAILLKEANRILLEVIDKLPPQQKMVYQLCKEEGLKYEQAAARMDISKLTVKTHMQHALRFIRQHLAKYTEIAIVLLIWQT